MELLKMLDISKAFSGVTVLNHVDFVVEEGEVHALLGENGAGKSTLMNILAGVYTRDTGTVEFDGKPLEHTTVRMSEQAGIAFVHQELNLFNDLKVYENIFLRKEIKNKFGVLDKKSMIAKTTELFESLGVEIDPTALVSQLSTSMKQLLEISKALFGNAKLLILDEPTTSLNNEEIDHLFTIIKRLKEQGKSIIFISHKMKEIFTIADRYTVLRNGEFIKTGYIKDTCPEDVTKLMVGSSYSSVEAYASRELGEPILELQKLCGNGFYDVDLSVRKGEIIGLTGLMGAGVSEMLRAIFGVEPIEGGKLIINGKTIEHNSIHKAMLSGVAMIAPNRKENSVIPDGTLLENKYISEHALNRKKQYIHKGRELADFMKRRQALNIKLNDPGDSILSLSGGNQQKVILARWLSTNADIILMDNPTQGIDVGAKAEIYRLILELARQGKTILVNTLEIPEVQKIADRCVVFYHGSVHTILERADINEETVMLHATNVIQAEGVIYG